MSHGLAQLFLSVNMLQQVRLVDDVYQVNELGYPPEDFANSNAQLPCVMNPLVDQLAYVKMASFRINAVDSCKGCCYEAGAALPLVVKFRLSGNRYAAALLS
jgi:hypothetical protein